MDQNQGIKTWQWVVTVIVIIILIVLGYYLFKGNGTTDTPVGDTVTTTDSVTDANEVNRIVISDQYPGNVVYISSVQTAQGAWVKIHKDVNGKPGAVIGSAWVDKGIAPVKITLTEKTAEGQLYYAMLYTDNGDKVFDAAKDLPMKDGRGNIIMKPFRASTTVTDMSKG